MLGRIERKMRWLGWTLGAAFLLLNASAYAQLPGYPAPRDPDYKTALKATVDDLMPIARLMVKKPARRMALEPGYAIKPGDNVLIVVNDQFSHRVLEAIHRAMVEAGAKVDIVRTNSVAPPPIVGNHGEREFKMMGGGGFPGSFLAKERGARAIWEANVTAGGKGYDLVVEGAGGPNPKAPYRWEYIPWDTVDKFQFSMAAFPYQIQDAIDHELWNILANAREIHATDPEGTNMTWHWKPDFVGMLHENWPGYAIVKQGHISAMPLFMSPKAADANGQVAGTINHAGTFPHLILTIAHNEIVKMQGGGVYGREWKKMLDECVTKRMHYPGFPGIGCGWFEEAAIGTDPWRTRDMTVDMNGDYAWERGRSGVIHWGFGVSANLEYHPTVNRWYRQNANKTPRGAAHDHIHTYLTTMDITEQNGKVVRVLDKGRLTMLDDPQVRKVASQFGNPDQLLREKWIPRYPGINLPGNYMKDYAANPYAYIHAYQEKVRKESGWKPPEGE